MAGSGGSFGFQAITDMGRALENAAKYGDRAELSTWIAQMEQHLRNVDVRFTQAP